MKTHLWKPLLMILLALIVEGCILQATPSPEATVPQPENIVPQNPDPGGPQPGNPQPGNPQPGNPQPGGGVQIEFMADAITLQPGQCTNLRWNVQGSFNVRLDGQPVDPVGQRQVCPNATTNYRLEADAGNQMIQRDVVINVGGGNPPQPTKPNGGGPGPAPTATVKTGGGTGPTKTPTTKSGGNIIQVSTILPLQLVDLAVSNIFPNASGKIMMTIKNTGAVKVSGSYKYVCSGSYTDSSGNHALALSGNYATVDLEPGKSADYDTGYSRNPTINEMWVSCTLTPPAADADSSNNSMGMTKVK